MWNENLNFILNYNSPRDIVKNDIPTNFLMSLYSKMFPEIIYFNKTGKSQFKMQIFKMKTKIKFFPYFGYVWSGYLTGRIDFHIARNRKFIWSTWNLIVDSFHFVLVQEVPEALVIYHRCNGFDFSNLIVVTVKLWIFVWLLIYIAQCNNSETWWRYQKG